DGPGVGAGHQRVPGDAVTAKSVADYAKRLECGAFPPLSYSHEQRLWLYKSGGKAPHSKRFA
ncbi:MAG: hypothetical protein QOH21_2711, partial [Acidobacteriota bacterium]|nr:hypothetical protein [Acidobacteriota bacterium]